MQPNTILMVNEKGGVGKSTAAWNIGYELSRAGARVLLVDTDKQRSLSLYPNDPSREPGALGEKIGMRARATVSDVIRTGEVAPAVLPTEFEGLEIVCAGRDTACFTDAELAGGLGDVIGWAEGSHDFVIVDFRRDFGETLRLMASACDMARVHAIVPVRSEDSFAEGIDAVVSDLGSLCGFTVLFTQVYRPNSKTLSVNDAAALSIMEADFPEVARFETLVTATPKVGEATYYGVPVAEAFPGNAAARDYRALAAEVSALFGEGE